MSPEGSGEVVVIASAALIVKVAESVAVCGVDAESFAWMVKLVVPAAVGVPERTPAELRLRPAGGVPDHIYGAVPPVAEIVTGP